MAAEKPAIKAPATDKKAAPVPPLKVAVTVDAPRDKVFKAWTDPEELRKWFAPCDPGSKAGGHQVDLRVGGKCTVLIKSATGGKSVVTGTYKAVRAPEKLVFAWPWREDPSRYREKEVGKTAGETTVTVLFRDQGGKTAIELTAGPFLHERARDSHVKGWKRNLSSLEKALRAS